MSYVADLEAALRELIEMHTHTPEERPMHCARGVDGCAICRVWTSLRRSRVDEPPWVVATRRALERVDDQVAKVEDSLERATKSMLENASVVIDRGPCGVQEQTDPDVCGMQNAVPPGLRCSRHTGHRGECMYLMQSILDACVLPTASVSEPDEASYKGARFECDDCALGRDCPDHDLSPEPGPPPVPRPSEALAERERIAAWIEADNGSWTPTSLANEIRHGEHWSTMSDAEYYAFAARVGGRLPPARSETALSPSLVDLLQELAGYFGSGDTAIDKGYVTRIEKALEATER